MVFEVLAVAGLVAVFWYARRARFDDVDLDQLPLDDHPPLEAMEPMPPRIQLRRYVGDGLADIEDYLAGRDQTA
jgi:hypothetical protein